MPRRKEVEHINDVSAKITERYLREEAMMFGECAINLMATCMPLTAVSEWLRAQADILDEHG